MTLFGGKYRTPQIGFSVSPHRVRPHSLASMKGAHLQLGGTNIWTRTRKCLGNANATFTAMICSLGTCRIFSTTPYAPRPSSTMGSRSSAFTSKFCRRQKRGCNRKFRSVQSLSRVRLCDPVDHSTPGLPVHHQIPEFTQTHAHRVGDAIQPSHPLSSPSPVPNPSQHQSLFQ